MSSEQNYSLKGALIVCLFASRCHQSAICSHRFERFTTIWIFVILPTIVVQCPDPGPGIETVLESRSTMYNYAETVSYQCSSSNAFVSQGNRTIHCQENGEWSESPPVCGNQIITFEN